MCKTVCKFCHTGPRHNKVVPRKTDDHFEDSFSVKLTVIGALGSSALIVWVAFLLHFYNYHIWAPIGYLCLLL